MEFYTETCRVIPQLFGILSSEKGKEAKGEKNKNGVGEGEGEKETTRNFGKTTTTLKRKGGCVSGKLLVGELGEDLENMYYH